MESPKHCAKMKEIIVENNYDLKTVFETEKFILNKISFSIELSTPFELETLILKEVLKDDENVLNCHSIIGDWVNFSIDEYKLYKKYDLFTLVIASILNCLDVNGKTDISKKIEEYILPLVESQKNLQECIKDIVEFCREDDDLGEEIDQMNIDDIPSELTKDQSYFISNQNTFLNDNTPMITISNFDEGSFALSSNNNLNFDSNIKIQEKFSSKNNFDTSSCTLDCSNSKNNSNIKLFSIRNKENVDFMNLSSNLDLIMPSASTNFSELPIKSSILRNKRKKSKKFLKKESPKFSKNIRVKKVKKYLKFKIQILHNKSEL